MTGAEPRRHFSLDSGVVACACTRDTRRLSIREPFLALVEWLCDEALERVPLTRQPTLLSLCSSCRPTQPLARFVLAISRLRPLCFADRRVDADACPPDEVACLQCPNGFTADYLREELARRNLDATGSKEEIISRLIADIAPNRSTTPPCLPQTPPRPPSVVTLRRSRQASSFTCRKRTAAPVQVTTLPDLSASLPTYSGDDSISASHWVEELERTRKLASWEPSTLLAVALGKLRGAAADWKAVIGRQCPTWKPSDKRS
ncbi:hypothetical protein HPB49_019016 [Dermacentor silvarum]|uniref:Uncharacterized protein n=1 Tax=Dermacentor silvarum TaxID=543639 RepID=A0ACB8DFF7_DERSI|nr:hypothetical protein HPB49_019016 [Dermacentor silvarum]